MQILTQQEGAERLLAAGWTNPVCTACSGEGKFVIVAEGAQNWKRYKCEACDGAGRVWQQPTSP